VHRVTFRLAATRLAQRPGAVGRVSGARGRPVVSTVPGAARPCRRHPRSLTERSEWKRPVHRIAFRLAAARLAQRPGPPGRVDGARGRSAVSTPPPVVDRAKRVETSRAPYRVSTRRCAARSTPGGGRPRRQRPGAVDRVSGTRGRSAVSRPPVVDRAKRVETSPAPPCRVSTRRCAARSTPGAARPRRQRPGAVDRVSGTRGRSAVSRPPVVDRAKRVETSRAPPCHVSTRRCAARSTPGGAWPRQRRAGAAGRVGGVRGRAVVSAGLGRLFG